MKRISIFFLIIILTFNIPLAYCPTDEGYGEDNDNLGQFVDSFEDSNNITVFDDTIRNATLECIELNYTGGGDRIYENLTAYTEFEEVGDRIIHYGDYNVSLDFIRNVDSRLYEDYGDGFFDEFEWDYEMRFNTTIADTAKIWFFLSNYTTNAYTQIVNTRRYLAIVMTQYAVQGQVIDVIEGREDGVQNFATSGDLAISTWYYNTFKLNQTYWELDIYSDSARTVLVETVSVALDEAKGVYRYLLMSSMDSNDVQRMMGNIRNIWLGNLTTGYETDGYIITDDYLNYTTGNSLALLTMAQIPVGTSITAQFSNDNSTWVNNEGNVGSSSLEDGLFALDLRDLNYTDIYSMFNFSGTALLTPRLNQTRLVTTNGTAGSVTVIHTGINSSGIAIVIFLCIIGLGLIIGVKKW